MILAVDPGIATCGWAVAAPGTGRIERCGVITTEKNGRVSRSVDRARRVAFVAQQLASVANGCTTLAAEAPLGFGSIHAVAPQQLAWGALVQLGAGLRMTVLEVTAKAWQHAVMPDAKRIDYAELERVLHAHVSVDAAAALDDIPNALLTHALDACGVGLLAALRPDDATVVIGHGLDRTAAPRRA